MESDPLQDAVTALDRLTGSDQWPKRWMTVPQFVAELDRRGFWSQVGFGALSAADKREFVMLAFQEHVLPGGLPVWSCIGSRYKHDSLLTQEDYQQLVEWCDERRRAAGEEAERWRETCNRRFGEGTL